MNEILNVITSAWNSFSMITTVNFIVYSVGVCYIAEVLILGLIKKFKDLLTVLGYIFKLLTLKPLEFQLPLVYDQIAKSSLLNPGQVVWCVNSQQWVTLYNVNQNVLLTVIDGVPTYLFDFEVWTQEQINELKLKWENDNPQALKLDKGPMINCAEYYHSFLNYLDK